MTVAFRLFVMMVLQIGMWGAWIPKLYPYMGMLGFSAGQMALVGTISGIAALVGLFGTNQLADRYFPAEKVLAASHLAGAVLLVLLSQATGFAAFFFLFLCYSLLFIPTISVTNTIALANLPEPARQFGPVRMGGTIGWVIVSWPFVFLLGAAPSIHDMRWIWLVAAIISVVLGLYALTLPTTPPDRSRAHERPAWGEAIRMLNRPYLGVLFAVTLIDSVIHNGYYVMADTFLTHRVGIAGNLSMVVLSLGQAAEILAMLLLGRVLARFGWRTTMMIGVAGHAARFLIFAFLADYPALIIGVQFVHGICYAFFFAALYIFIDDVCPPGARVSVQGLFNILVLGVGTVVASWIFPWLMSVLLIPDPAGTGMTTDFRTLFLIPAAMSAAGCLILLFAFRPPEHRPSGRGRQAAASRKAA